MIYGIIYVVLVISCGFHRYVHDMKEMEPYGPLTISEFFWLIIFMAIVEGILSPLVLFAKGVEVLREDFLYFIGRK